VIDDLLEHNRTYLAGHGHRELATSPALHLAVLTCMDSRLDLFGALGLELGEAHLIRNAGGIATDDAVRSLLLSQRLLGTRSIMVIHHSRCGLESFDEEELQIELEQSFGERAPFRLGAHRVDPATEPLRRHHRGEGVRLQRRRRRPARSTTRLAAS